MVKTMMCNKYIMNLMRSLEQTLTDIHRVLRERSKFCLLQRQSITLECSLQYSTAGTLFKALHRQLWFKVLPSKPQSDDFSVF